MVATLRLRLLAREVELKSYFGSVISEDLDEARQNAEALDAQLILLTALISTGIKTSRLLWQYGRRASDHVVAEEAETLRSILALDDRSPLAPARITPLAPALLASALELAEAWTPETCEISLEGTAYQIGSLQKAMIELNQRVHSLAAPGRGTMLDWH